MQLLSPHVFTARRVLPDRGKSASRVSNNSRENTRVISYEWEAIGGGVGGNDGGGNAVAPLFLPVPFLPPPPPSQINIITFLTSR